MESTFGRVKRDPIYVDVKLSDEDVCAICLKVLDIRKEDDDEVALEAAMDTLRVLPYQHFSTRPTFGSGLCLMYHVLYVIIGILL
jgi:hypothetical protein